MARGSNAMRTMLTRIALVLMAVWGVGWLALLSAFVMSSEDIDADGRAILRMAVALAVVWCGAGGIVMVLARDRFVGWARRVLAVGWGWRFVLLCVGFAMIEEAITTTLTNLAPRFGAASDAARITASKNYLVVVFQTSVIVFVPMFLAWAWMLKRYDFRPAEVFLLFGITGTLAETMSFGPQNLMQMGMWVYVYGLVVYLPAATVPEDRRARPVRWWHWPMAVVMPILWSLPVVGLVLLLGGGG